MPNTPPPVAPQWGPGRSGSPDGGRRTALLAVLVAALGLAGVAVGLLFWFTPPRPPAAVPVWVTAEPGGPGAVPWAAQDRAALLADDLLGRPADDPGANPNRDQLRLRFRALANARRSQPVVIYLSAPAAVDASGAVYLLPADPAGDHPRNRLPLAELLGHVRDCPAEHKLLVLQLTPPAEDPLFAPPVGDLSAAVHRTLAEVADERRLCLAACGPGQAPLASPDLGRTVFGYYLEAGLRGAADGWGPKGDRDGRVTVTELAAFVRVRAGRWADANLRPPQTPVLVGDAADFTLRTYLLSEGGPVAPEAAGVSTYPDWLRAGWERHDRWNPAQPPRALQRLRAALLAAERDLRAGRPAPDVQRELDRQLAEVDQLAAALAAVPAANPLPTLAATFPGYTPTDAGLLEELRTAVIRAEARPASAPEKPGEKLPPAPPPAEFEPLVKAKPHRDLALAAFRLLAEDPAPSAARVRLLARLLATQEPAPRFSETLLVQRLADLADPAAVVPWSPDRVALALQTARLLEDAAARLVVVAYAEAALDAAYRKRADAEAVLFSPGYASPAEADARLKVAADAARELKANADQLRSALAARDEAVNWLTGATAAVDTGVVPLADAVRLADATRRLADALAVSEKPADAATFVGLASDWQEKEAAVRATLGGVQRPFRPDALARLRARAEAGDAGPAVLAELDAVLLTPLVPAAERIALWTTRAALTRRLNEEAVRRDAADDESFRKGSRPPATDPREPVTVPALDSDRLTRRAAVHAALLRVGGEDTTAEAELARLVNDSPGFAARLRRVWLEDVPTRLAQAAGPEAARLARVVPVVPAVAFLDQPARNPHAILHREHVRRLWAWHAARFEYETRNPVAARPAGTDLKVSAAPEPYLELAPAAQPVLTAEKPADELRVNLRLIGSPGPRPVTARVLTPDAEWVRITGEGKADLGPVQERTATFGVAAGSRPFAHPELRGVLVEAEVDGRTYHRRVPVSLDSLVNRLDLLVRSGPADAPRPAREIALRPNGVPQSVQLLVSNPTPRPRTVVGRLAGFDRVTAPLTVEPGKFALLRFPAPPPAAAPAPPAPPLPTGQPAAPAEPAFDPLNGPLVVELLDPADPEWVQQRFSVPVRVLDPAQYLKVERASFRPAGTRPNRLSVEVVPENVPPGPPVQVAVTLPPDRNPDVLPVRDANLSGPLPPDNRSLTLYAEDVGFTTPAGGRVVVTVAADGVERAFTYTGSLPASGSPVQLAAEVRPLVRVKAAEYALTATPLPVRVEVDNAPDGSRVELRLGTDKPDPTTGAAAFAADVTRVIEPAKERAAGVRFDPKGETLLLRGTLKDPAPVLPIGYLVGPRVLEARLLDAAGAELARHRTTVIFDGSPPNDVRFLDLPPRAAKGQPLTVKATCEPPVSGIKEVKFFLGAPVKGELPSSPAPVPGQLVDPKGNVWQAALQPAKDADRVTVGVQFTAKAGLSKVETADVVLVDAAELNKPAPGAITGKLVEGSIPQPGAVVYLYDEKAAPKAQTKTKDDGTFEFKDLPPGKYFLYSLKESTNRESKVEVTVKPGATEKKTMELLLK